MQPFFSGHNIWTEGVSVRNPTV